VHPRLFYHDEAQRTKDMSVYHRLSTLELIALLLKMKLSSLVAVLKVPPLPGKSAPALRVTSKPMKPLRIEP
jgi:hypothetical protein